ncbi:hypothetical protein SO802_023465 [Lithocarpus litseifolius]|uniref:Uncharacterized protein n=1 Tax=Lithocarpus litseifolius TaxID=425828 RepID=A0AAW2C6R9_9ROSI
MSESEMVIPSLNPGGEVDCTKIDPEMVIPGLNPGGYVVCTNIDPEMVIPGLNPGGYVVCTNIDPELVEKLNPVAELSDSGIDTKPRFNKQKLWSVIPKQRKLVKLLMFERLAQFLRHVFCPRGASSSPANKSFCCFKNVYPQDGQPEANHCSRRHSWRPRFDVINLYKKLHNLEVAVNTMAEANKEVKLSSSEEEVSSSEEELSYNTEQWFNKPKNGSVIPVKRKSVMKMIFTSVLANKSAPHPQTQSNKVGCLFQKGKG